LDTLEAQKGLKKEPSLDDFGYYLRQGWPPRLIQTLLIEAVQVPAALIAELEVRYDNKCENAPNIASCRFREGIPACTKRKSSVKLRGVRYLIFSNDVENRCEYEYFQWFLEALALSGGNLDFNAPPLVSDTKPSGSSNGKKGSRKNINITVNVAEPKKKAAAPERVTRLVFVGDEELQEFLDKLRRTFDKPENDDEKARPIPPFDAIFRSPERMVRFLGQVIAVQSLAKARYMPEITMNNNTVPFFKVHRGNAKQGRTVVGVKGPEGEKFGIPMPDHGSSKRHRSLQSLALVMDFLNGAISGQVIPSPNTVLLR